MLGVILLDSVCREVAMAWSQGGTGTASLIPKELDETDERAYRRLVDDALRYKVNRKIINRKPAHAVYVLRRFFECARNDVRIYTGRLSRSIGNVRAYADPEIVAAAVEFLRREESRLSIVILGAPDVDPGQPLESHPLLAAISEAEGIRGTVCVSRGDLREWKDFPYHFIIMDREAVRIEFDGNSVDAALRFGDAHFVSRLVRIYDEFEQNGSSLLRMDPDGTGRRLPDGSATRAC